MGDSAIQWGDVGIVASTLVAICVLAGLATRFVLVPYLKEHVVKPVAETHRQVTQNRHSNPEPTVLDRLDDVHDEVKRLNDTMVAVQAVANAAARSSAGAHRRIESHNAWADVEVSRLWNALRRPTHRDADREERD